MITRRTILFPERALLMAPMEDISDPPFRILCKRYGADVVFTEFVSSEGLIRDAEKSLKKLDIFPEERPVGIQIFGHDESSMRKAAELAEKAMPDYIDINFGCPVKKVVGKGAGAALLKDLNKMQLLAKAVVQAVSIPVTAKTRLGWDEANLNIMEAALCLQDAGISALSIHGRTKSQMYGGKADWSLIGAVKKHPEIEIPIIGNGDIDGPEIALEMFEKHKVDGIMIGRAIIGNPFIFKEIRHFLEHGTLCPPIDITERVNVCLEHLRQSIEWKGERAGMLEMRKHYGGYFKGIAGIKSIRMELVTASSFSDIQAILSKLS